MRTPSNKVTQVKFYTELPQLSLTNTIIILIHKFLNKNMVYKEKLSFFKAFALNEKVKDAEKNYLKETKENITRHENLVLSRKIMADMAPIIFQRM